MGDYTVQALTLPDAYVLGRRNTRYGAPRRTPSSKPAGSRWREPTSR